MNCSQMCLCVYVVVVYEWIIVCSTTLHRNLHALSCNTQSYIHILTTTYTLWINCICWYICILLYVYIYSGEWIGVLGRRCQAWKEMVGLFVVRMHTNGCWWCWLLYVHMKVVLIHVYICVKYRIDCFHTVFYTSCFMYNNCLHTNHHYTIYI